MVRASYVSSDQTMMGTIGVVNLSSANDAAKAGNASGANDFVTPLNGKTGPTRNLSQGTGVVQAEYKGHYLILIWAEFANLQGAVDHGPADSAGAVRVRPHLRQRQHRPEQPHGERPSRRPPEVPDSGPQRARQRPTPSGRRRGPHPARRAGPGGEFPGGG